MSSLRLAGREPNAVAGLARATGAAYLAPSGGSIFLLLIAFYLAMGNWQKLQDLGRRQG